MVLKSGRYGGSEVITEGESTDEGRDTTIEKSFGGFLDRFGRALALGYRWNKVHTHAAST
jgi:hypothetical protein